jgi:hypothetical protein
MKVPRLRGLAASAVALATLALPLQAMAAPHRGDDQARCNQIQKLEQRFPQLSQNYPGLQQALEACTAAAPASLLMSFNDLSGYSWAQSDIDLMQSMGIMKGVGRGLFQPGGILTRVQFAALLQRVFHLSVPSNPIQFVDVNQGFWGYNAVEAAAPFMGEFQTPGGLAFEPDLPMVRIDVAASLGKIEVAEGMATLPTTAAAQAVWATYADGSLVPAGLSQYAAVAVQTGIMKGYANGSFGVEDTLNRAQAAVLLARVLQGTETMPTGTATIGGTTTLQGTFASTSGSTLTITTSSGSQSLTLSPSGVTVTINGASGSLSGLTSGESITVTLNAQQQVIAIAATSNNTSVSTLSGTVVSVTSSSIVLNIPGVSLPVTLNFAPGTSLTATVGDSVTVSLNSDGQVVAIAVTNTTSTVSGTVNGVNATTITVNNTAYTLSASGVTVTGDASSLGGVATGDTVTLTLTNNQVTAIDVTSAVSTLTGTVTGVSSSQISISVNGASPVTFTIASGATVTVNGTSATLSAVTGGETVTLTLSNGQVTAIAVAGPVATHTVTGYIVSDSASSVTVAVYGSGGTSQTGYSIDTGANVTLNGSTVAVSSLPLGDAATVGLDANNGVASIAATTPSDQVTGQLVGINATTAQVLLANNTIKTVSLGSAPVAFVNGGVVAVTSLALDQSITIDPTELNGSALLVR